MTLNDLALKYGSDKSSEWHNYCEFYEWQLPKTPKKILEIGVKKGASIRMWKDWFPESEIHGLDLFEEFSIPNIDGITWHKGNQCDYLLLEQLRNEDFDLIIDDGSHICRHQMITFFGLYNGKHYFIEDCHTCDEAFYLETLPQAMSAKYLFTDNHPRSYHISDTKFVNWQGKIVLIKSQTIQ